MSKCSIHGEKHEPKYVWAGLAVCSCGQLMAPKPTPVLNDTPSRDCPKCGMPCSQRSCIFSQQIVAYRKAVQMSCTWCYFDIKLEGWE